MQQNTQQDRRVDIKEEVRMHAVLWEMFRLLIFGLTSVYFFHREVAPKMCFYDKWFAGLLLILLWVFWGVLFPPNKWMHL